MVPFNPNRHWKVDRHPSLTYIRRILGKPHLEVIYNRDARTYVLVTQLANRHMQEHTILRSWPVVTASDTAELTRMFNPDPRFTRADDREILRDAAEYRERRAREGHEYRESQRRVAHHLKKIGKKIAAENPIYHPPVLPGEG